MYIDNRASNLKQHILTLSTLRHQAWPQTWHLASYITEEP